MKNCMKRFSLFGLLVVSLVIINCASTPKGPSPFEGTWFFDYIEERGSRTQEDSLPDALLISGNKFSIRVSWENPNGTRGSVMAIVAEKFTYTNNVITVGSGKSARVFQYTLDAGRLTLTDASFGKIIWRKGN